MYVCEKKKRTWDVGEMWGNWASGMLMRMGATCSYVCVMEARSVKLKILVERPVGQDRSDFWMLVFFSGQVRDEWKGETLDLGRAGKGTGGLE